MVALYGGGALKAEKVKNRHGEEWVLEPVGVCGSKTQCSRRRKP